MTRRPSLLLVDDDGPFRTVMAAELARTGYDVCVAATGDEALHLSAESDPQVILLDLQLPDMSGLDVLKALKQRHAPGEVVMLTGHGSIDSAIESIRIGAFDYVSKPCPLDELDIRIQRALERQALRQRAALLERGLTPPDLGHVFIGESPEFSQVLQLIGRVAQSSSTVLMTGETGTGKEMAAKLIHAKSARRTKPFVTVECAALQESLLQSELFGHERGAFTGADRAKPGLFEVASGGTIFLDEIGEISLATQVSLLRVLDTSTFRHVGGTNEIKVDVRILAATNRDLAGMVRQGLFREDLYYRLSTISIRLPALRERKDDIGLLARHFVHVFNARFGVNRNIDGAALDLLERHPWPGNVRELLHVVEAAMIVCDGPVIRPEHLPASVRSAGSGAPVAAGGAIQSAPGSPEGRTLTLEEVERAHIDRVLREHNGHRGHAARALGISERNLYRKLQAAESGVRSQETGVRRRESGDKGQG
ncbi:MAG: sigma-54 dependent transcriptional regulator [Acidobacteriota bacterium]